MDRELYELDLYELLGVPPTAPTRKINGARRDHAKRLHPDRLNEDEKAAGEEELKLINQAADLLEDDERRADYDLTREARDGPDRPEEAAFPDPDPDTVDFGTLRPGEVRDTTVDVYALGSRPRLDVRLDREMGRYWRATGVEEEPEDNPDAVVRIGITVEVPLTVSPGPVEEEFFVVFEHTNKARVTLRFFISAISSGPTTHPTPPSFTTRPPAVVRPSPSADPDPGRFVAVSS